MTSKIVPDYSDIVDIAQHCDMSKLQIAQNKALNFDLTNIICKYGKEIENADADDPIFTGGKIGFIDFGGLNRISAYFSYARYAQGSIYVDTGSGLVRKSHNNSIPFAKDDVDNLANQHRLMARNEIERLEAYLCSLKEGKCFCNHEICCKKSNSKTYAINNTGTNLRIHDDLRNY